MAKKRSKAKSIKSVRKNKDNFIDDRINALFPGLVLGLEQKISVMSEELMNIKGNLITVTTLLEKHKILNKSEFYAEYRKYMNEEGLVDGEGNMDGKAIITIYNEEI